MELTTKSASILVKKFVIYLNQNKYLWSFPLLIGLIFVTFPAFFSPMKVGLDPSWQYGLNYLAQSDYIFGQDVAFSYGPLGFMLVPLNIGSNIIYVVVLWCLIHIIFAFILFYLTFRSKRLLPTLLFIGAYILSFILGWKYLGMLYECYLGLIVGLLCYIAFIDAHRIQYFAAATAGILACLSLFMKLNLGLASITTIIIWIAICIIRKKASFKIIIPLTGAAYIVMLLLLSELYFQSYVNFITWVKTSFEITAGYSAAMSVIGSHTILALGLMCLVIYIAFTFLVLKNKWSISLICIIFISQVFFNFKHGFVRQDEHVMFFFLFLLPLVSFLILTSIKNNELKYSIFSFLACLILTVPVLMSFHSMPSYGDAWATISGKIGKSHINFINNLEGVQSWLDKKSEANLKEDQLPAEWLQEIGNSTVDTVPWEIAYCPSNNLEWSPNPILQIYSAYTSSLDLKSASHYSDIDSPDFLIVEFKDIDGRHPLLSEPATWNSIISNYNLFFEDLNSNRLLLKRKHQSQNESITVLNQEKAKVGQWISVPDSHNLIYADIDMRFNILGTISNTIFRIPPVYIDLEYKSGRIASYRFIPDTAKNGLLINYLPLNLDDLKNLLDGKSNDKVVKFKVNSNNTLYFNKLVKIIWKETSSDVNSQLVNTQLFTLIKDNTNFGIDTINGHLISEEDSSTTIDSSTEEIITITGYAVDKMAKNAASGVFINIDGKRDILASYGLDRSDVSRYFSINDYRYSGFSVSFTSSIIDKGLHTLSLKIITADQKGYYQPDQKIILIIK